MEEEYSRRKQQRPASTSKPIVVTVILLLLINTILLGVLLFLNVQTTSKHEAQLNSIEEQVSKLDKAQVTDNTEHNVLSSESSTQVSTIDDSNSSTESSSETDQTSASSSEVATQTEPSTEPAQAPAATTYTVQAGDTLSVIAEKNKLSLQDLMIKNNLSDSTVYIGQVLSLQ